MILQTLGIKLSDPPKPGGSYVSVNVRGRWRTLQFNFLSPAIDTFTPVVSEKT
jgi:hypothetical protein